MIFFVCGLSKSGKTTLSQYAASELPEIEHVSVSRLLKNASVKLPVSTLTDGLANQKVAALALRAQSYEKKHRLIDGHALVETLEGPILVPDWFFDEVRPDVLLFLHEKPEILLARRKQALCSSTIAEMTALSSMEYSACERIAARFNLKLCRLQSPSREQFVRLLRTNLLSLA